MDMLRIYLFLCVNLVAAEVAYYRKCYDALSFCLLTNTEDSLDGSPVRLNQSSAVHWCSGHSSTLVSIANETVQSAIKDFIDDSSVHQLVVTSGYRIILSDWKWVDGRRSDVRSDTDPRVYRYAYLVVESRRTYLRFYGTATHKRRFICSYDLNDNFSCQESYHRLGRGCYKIHNREVTWFDARNTCLKERSDLATFEDGNFSLTFEFRNVVEYWIGLRKEIWRWTTGQDIIFSNWENSSPHYENGECLCLRATTGKWKECDCSQKYRYICNQAAETSTTQAITAITTTNATIVTPSKTITTSTRPTTKTTTKPTSTTKTIKTTTTKPSSTKKTTKTTTTKPPSTTKTTKTTTKKPTSTTKTTPSTTTLKVTLSTSTAKPTGGRPSSQSHSTSTQALEDNMRNKTSADQTILLRSEEQSGILVALGIGSVCLLILIIVIVVVVVMKHRRSRSGDVGPKQIDSPSQTIPEGDAPNSVYATVVPNTSERAPSTSENTSNQIVYAELDLVTPKRKATTLKASKAVVSSSEKTPNETVYAEVGLVATKAETTQRNSKAVGSSVEKNQNQIVYAELDLVPKQGNKRGRAWPESEYSNGIPLESVYANSTSN